MIDKILNWLWSLLPDECEMPDCQGGGVRGNENLVNLGGEIRVMCDYCTARYMEESAGEFTPQ